MARRRKNSEFKLVVLCLKTDLVSHRVRRGEVELRRLLCAWFSFENVVR